MSDALDPIRHVYGETGGSAPSAPGEHQQAEVRLLRSTRAVLDAMPRHRPDPAALDAIAERVAAHVYAPLQAVYGEGTPPAPGDPQYVEYRTLAGTRAALDAFPAYAPDPKAVEAVEEAAAAATVAPVRTVYEGEGTSEGREAEVALLQSTKAALDRLPRVRPDAAVLAAITAEAARAVGSVPVANRAADRPARPRGVRRRWTSTLAFAATLVIVAASGLWVSSQMGNGAEAESALADATPPPAEQQVPADADVAEAVPDLEEAFAAAPVPSAAPPTANPRRLPPAAPGLVAGGQIAERRQREVASSRDENAPSVAAPAEPRAAFAEGAIANDSEADFADEAVTLTAAEWEAGEDVRVLSMRLQQLAEASHGLGWDTPPTPLGATDSVLSADPNIHSAGSAPARVNVRARPVSNGASGQ